MAWSSLKTITPFIASRLNLKKQINSDEVCVLWARMAVSIFGKDNFEKFKPLYLKNRTLFVKCPNSSWANELQMRQHELLAKLNANSRKTKVERINFVF